MEDILNQFIYLLISICLQDLESDKVKNHLTILAKRLNKAVNLIQPPSLERPSRQILPFSELQNVVEKEHKKLLARKVLIERRKEEQERQMLEMVWIVAFQSGLTCILTSLSVFWSLYFYPVCVWTLMVFVT